MSANQKFYFQQRRGGLKLRKFANMDIERVIEEVDIDLLQNHLEELTFCALKEEDIKFMTDPLLVKLFRTAQLMIEYLLFTQSQLAGNLGSLAGKYSAQKRALLRKRQEHTELQELVTLLESEVQTKKQGIAVLEALLLDSSKASLAEKEADAANAKAQQAAEQDKTVALTQIQEIPEVLHFYVIDGARGMCVEFSERRETLLEKVAGAAASLFMGAQGATHGVGAVKLVHRGVVLSEIKTLEECGLADGDSLVCIGSSSEAAVQQPQADVETALEKEKEKRIQEREADMQAMLMGQERALRNMTDELRGSFESVMNNRSQEVVSFDGGGEVLSRLDERYSKYESGMRQQLDAQLVQYEQIITKATGDLRKSGAGDLESDDEAERVDPRPRHVRHLEQQIAETSDAVKNVGAALARQNDEFRSMTEKFLRASLERPPAALAPVPVPSSAAAALVLKNEAESSDDELVLEARKKLQRNGDKDPIPASGPAQLVEDEVLDMEVLDLSFDKDPNPSSSQPTTAKAQDKAGGPLPFDYDQKRRYTEFGAELPLHADKSFAKMKMQVVREQGVYVRPTAGPMYEPEAENVGALDCGDVCVVIGIVEGEGGPFYKLEGYGSGGYCPIKKGGKPIFEEYLLGDYLKKALTAQKETPKVAEVAKVAVAKTETLNSKASNPVAAEAAKPATNAITSPKSYAEILKPAAAQPAKSKVPQKPARPAPAAVPAVVPANVPATEPTAVPVTVDVPTAAPSAESKSKSVESVAGIFPPVSEEEPPVAAAEQAVAGGSSSNNVRESRDSVGWNEVDKDATFEMRSVDVELPRSFNADVASLLEEDEAGIKLSVPEGISIDDLFFELRRSVSLRAVVELSVVDLYLDGQCVTEDPSCLSHADQAAALAMGGRLVVRIREVAPAFAPAPAAEVPQAELSQEPAAVAVAVAQVEPTRMRVMFEHGAYVRPHAAPMENGEEENVGEIDEGDIVLVIAEVQGEEGGPYYQLDGYGSGGFVPIFKHGKPIFALLEEGESQLDLSQGKQGEYLQDISESMEQIETLEGSPNAKQPPQAAAAAAYDMQDVSGNISGGAHMFLNKSQETEDNSASGTFLPKQAAGDDRDVKTDLLTRFEGAEDNVNIASLTFDSEDNMTTLRQAAAGGMGGRVKDSVDSYGMRESQNSWQSMPDGDAALMSSSAEFSMDAAGNLQAVASPSPFKHVQEDASLALSEDSDFNPFR